MRQFDDRSPGVLERDAKPSSDGASTVTLEDIGAAARRALLRAHHDRPRELRSQELTITAVQDLDVVGLDVVDLELGTDPLALGSAIEKAEALLSSLQAEDGHWCGELEGNTILETEYMLLLEFLGLSTEERFRRAAEYVRRKQQPHGGWSIYPHGPADVSTSVKAYFALKLSGDPPRAPHMIKARRAILDLGGIEATNSFTKIYLSIFGQYDWDHCPAIPPEMILLPKWFYFNIYEMSSWSRVMVVPLSVLWAQKPVHRVPECAAIHELRAPRVPASQSHEEAPRQGNTEERLWRGFFHRLDRTLKIIEHTNLRPLRRIALARAEQWLLKRMEMSDGVGAIFPPIINCVFALRSLGYPSDHARIREQLFELEKLEIHDEESLRVQPCFGPVWDTSIALRTLMEVMPGSSDPRLLTAARWLLSKEVRHSGDWKVKSPRAKTGGWFFQYENAFNPDCDDTAQVLTDLAGLDFPNPADREKAFSARQRGIRWLLHMQNQDGGWGAFDKGCTKRVLTYVPFADHNAMIDPSCADITGRVLEALGRAGMDRSHRAVERGIAYLHATQYPDGSWSGRWGSNYIYGTWLALQGLARVGENMALARYQRAADWLRRCQTESGGWGESFKSYENAAEKGHGPVTATQTAWALLGIFATSDFQSETVHRGVNHLLGTQHESGGWNDEHWTGTGFPKVFYLRYHLYDKYFPLLALATYRSNLAPSTGKGATR